MTDYFEGWYFKHQHRGRTLALIPGRSSEGAFLQVVTDEGARMVWFSPEDYRRDAPAQLGVNQFDDKGIYLDIRQPDCTLKGALYYRQLTPLKSDIMGPFRFLPMECRHSVRSLYHRVEGSLMYNGEVWDFDGGTGYIEGDRGRSFPKAYSWIQCSDFEEPMSVMVSIAKIPALGGWFWGCIASVWHEGREFRLATYRGVRIVARRENYIELRQGKQRLIINIDPAEGHDLPAPEAGVMRRLIKESPSCPARFRFFHGDTMLFDRSSSHASCEFVEG